MTKKSNWDKVRKEIDAWNAQLLKEGGILRPEIPWWEWYGDGKLIEEGEIPSIKNMGPDELEAWAKERFARPKERTAAAYTRLSAHETASIQKVR